MTVTNPVCCPARLATEPRGYRSGRYSGGETVCLEQARVLEWQPVLGRCHEYRSAGKRRRKISQDNLAATFGAVLLIRRQLVVWLRASIIPRRVFPKPVLASLGGLPFSAAGQAKEQNDDAVTE